MDVENHAFGFEKYTMNENHSLTGIAQMFDHKIYF